MNAIIYNRVSTDHQAQFGYSLDYQNETIQRYCQMRGYNVVQVYYEDCSAKNFEKRPEWNNLLKFIRSNKGLVQRVVMLRTDRYSRKVIFSMLEEEKLKKLGVYIEYAEGGNLDMDNPESLLIKLIQYGQAEVENEKISKRTKEGIYEARIKGCIAGRAPLGYTNIRIGKDSTMEPSEIAHLIKEAFERMASGNYSAEEVRRWLNLKNVKVSKNNFPNIIRNVSYIGKIPIKSFKGMPARIVEGLHPAIVSDEVFSAANDALNGRSRKVKRYTDRTEKFPLNKVFMCPIHKRTLTGSKSKSRSGTYHSYYCCTKNSSASNCGNRFRVVDLEDKVIGILRTIQVSAQAVKMYKKSLKSVFNQEDLARMKGIRDLETNISTYRTRLDNLQNKYLDGEIPYPEFSDLKRLIDLQLFNSEKSLIQLKELASPFDEYLNRQVPMLEDLVGFYQSSSGKVKARILGCIFSEKVEILNGENTTTPISEPFSLLLNIGKGLQRAEKEKEVNFDLFPICAP